MYVQCIVSCFLIFLCIQFTNAQQNETTQRNQNVPQQIPENKHNVQSNPADIQQYDTEMSQSKLFCPGLSIGSHPNQSDVTINGIPQNDFRYGSPISSMNSIDVDIKQTNLYLQKTGTPVHVTISLHSSNSSGMSIMYVFFFFFLNLKLKLTNFFFF